MGREFTVFPPRKRKINDFAVRIWVSLGILSTQDEVDFGFSPLFLVGFCRILKKKN